MWNKPNHLVAYWDLFSRPAQSAKYDIGVVSTWWYDTQKAARINSAQPVRRPCSPISCAASFLMIPTIFGILLISFVIVQFAPGGPVERILAQLQGLDTSATANFSGGAEARMGGGATEFGSRYRGAQGLDPKFIAELKKQFGFDKPPLERFWLMLKNYLRFDFGNSYFRDVPVVELIKEKLPVSISLGLWMTLFSYLISIPLGIAKAVRDGSRFDVWTSAVVIVGYAIPSFLFAILLIVLFCGGSFWQIFPLRGLTSENFATLSLLGKIEDYLWHITLPVLCADARRLRDHDLSHQEFLPRRDPQAICADRADEGPDASGACSMGMCSATR